LATPIQSGTLASAASTTSKTGTLFSANTGVGNLVVVSIAMSGSTNNPSPTVSHVNEASSTGGAFTKAGAVSNGSGSSGIRCEVWYYITTLAQATFSVTVSTTCAFVVSGAEYDGTLYTNTVDGTVQTKTGSGTAETTTSITTTNAQDLLVAGFAMLANGTFSAATNSYVIETQAGQGSFGANKNATGTQSSTITDRTVTATGAYSTGVTGSNSVVWASVSVAFQDAVPPVTTGAEPNTFVGVISDNYNSKRILGNWFMNMKTDGFLSLPPPVVPAANGDIIYVVDRDAWGYGY